VCSSILCVNCTYVWHIQLWFKLFNLHVPIIFFMKSFCTQVNEGVICNHYLQDKFIHNLLHRRAQGLYCSPLIALCQSRVVDDSPKHHGYPSHVPHPRYQIPFISTPVVSCDAICQHITDIAATHIVVQSCHGFHVQFPFMVGVWVCMFAFAFGYGYSTCGHGCKCGDLALLLLSTWTCWCEATEWKHTLYLST